MKGFMSGNMEKLKENVFWCRVTVSWRSLDILCAFVVPNIYGITEFFLKRLDFEFVQTPLHFCPFRIYGPGKLQKFVGPDLKFRQIYLGNVYMNKMANNQDMDEGVLRKNLEPSILERALHIRVKIRLSVGGIFSVLQEKNNAFVDRATLRRLQTAREREITSNRDLKK